MPYLLAFFIALFSFSLSAKPLKEADLINWMQAMPKMEVLFNQHASKLSSSKIDFNTMKPEQVSSLVTENLKRNDLYDTFSQTLAKNALSPEAFFETQTKVMQAFMAISKNAMPSELELQLAETMNDLENTAGLTQEQKAAMKKQVEMMFGQSQFIKQQPDSDMKLILKYQEQIQKMMQK